MSLSASLSGGVVAFESFTGEPGTWGPVGGTSEATPEFAGIVDVTKGANSVSFTLNGKSFAIKGYRAKPGYDLVTGVGTIDAALFIPELARLR